eukprot:TRINITY_DN2632_c0_g4_i1.p1 TRINITY_DN2632_c0_g4~~TRINITY_DN2632_c0_g4_i1.p1  ORF type:complete len:1915 (+),score=307.93 TRINITY_DN2632_c0_g4_i1:101-5845(+)
MSIIVPNSVVPGAIPEDPPRATGAAAAAASETGAESKELGGSGSGNADDLERPGDRYLVIISNGDPAAGRLPRIRLRKKELEVCRRSLYLFPLDTVFRQRVIELVCHWAFEKFVLFLILLNSICLAAYDHRSSPDTGFNMVSDRYIDPILTVFFTLELVLKVIAFGFILDKKSYLREAWNWLDFIVVITAILEATNVSQDGMAFLRMFRMLRPLRSLNAVPQMKVLVNTFMSSIPKLGNVSIMGAFLFGTFGILGLSMFDGVFLHSCRTTDTPQLINFAGQECWSWNVTGDARLCGGAYMCKDPPEGVAQGFCGSHEQDMDESLRPKFPGGRRSFPWCPGSDPQRVFPESEWINFEHMGSALLTIFQCMTVEGWTDVMYRVQDGYGYWQSTVYFFCLIPVTSFFLLNVALAVVDEAREDFEDENSEQADEEKPKPVSRSSIVGQWVNKAGSDMAKAMEQSLHPDGADGQEVLWMDNGLVRLLKRIAVNEVFASFILFIIAANVVVMMMASFTTNISEQVSTLDFTNICEKVFLGIFLVEMAIMLGAFGPKRYLTTPVMCFDGLIVLISLIQVLSGDGGPFAALRTLRLLRVLNKLATRWPSFRVLLKAMLYTARSLVYWIVLFSLFLYISTLLWLQLFARKMHFEDVETLAKISSTQNKPWCADDSKRWTRQECIPRAHFDTFLWSWVTIFQIMTGENWNTIMYAGMRAGGWPFAVFFVGLIVFGQILFLSLFLSMLLSKFDQVQDEMEQAEKERTAGKMQRMMSFKILLKTTIEWAGHRRIDPAKVVPIEAFEEAKAQPTEEVKQLSPKARAGPKPWENEAPEDEEDDEYDSPKKPSTPPSSEGQCGGQNEAAAVAVVRPETPHDAPPDLPMNVEQEKQDEQEPSQPRNWPHGYALFVFSEDNPIRKACLWLLRAEATFRGDKIKVFDNAILFCILVSSIGMAIDTPLADPRAPLTMVIRSSDKMFAVIFATEMAIKLVAFGFVWAEHAYLKDGWNILDGFVVIVSLLDMATPGSGGILKTLRILRAFRPLRIISKNENLKVVVQTIFSSLLDLFTLMIVALLFLLIFALIFLDGLSGRLYHCTQPDTGVALLRDLQGFRTPLCLGSDPASLAPQSCPAGLFLDEAWNQSVGCGVSGSTCATSFTVSWTRPTVDTPICVGRCDGAKSPGDDMRVTNPPDLCPRPLTKVSELPSVCDGSDALEYNVSEDERRGREYRDAMFRSLIIPCGGSTVNSTGSVVQTGRAMSCREAFCPEGVSKEKTDQCRSDCEMHPHFCVSACEGRARSAECQSCRQECVASCECADHCEPLIKDAALCVEQGGRWEQSLSQNFDNVWTSMLTLFEISSTEGWVDVMYAACDITSEYEEPIRDNNEWLWAPLFTLYMLFSNMFIINLSVGVIVDKFMDLKQEGISNVMLTSGQSAWVSDWQNSQSALLRRRNFFDVTDLHLLPWFRRKVYDFISSRYFQGSIMAAISLNSVLMALNIFPAPLVWWDDFLRIGKLCFFVIFTLEFLLKFYGLHGAYWEDRWNQFDFFCILVSTTGYILEWTDTVNISSVTSIVRVARLFRLMRLMKGVNKIFAALAMSIPKLLNVVLILLLLLVLYSILGVSLFSTLKPGETLNEHGNFKHFGYAFITLFRASTGEAWNEIMHDLVKSPSDHYRKGNWCTPDYLFQVDEEDSWKALSDKCLIERPNACVIPWFNGQLMPVLYWGSYTLIVSIMVMNLVIAVILESYEEGKDTRDGDTIELSIHVWKKYDPNQTMNIGPEKAVQFIFEVLNLVKDEKGESVRNTCPDESMDFARVAAVPMKLVKTLNLKTDETGWVNFFSALQQVQKLVCANTDPEAVNEINKFEEEDAKTAARMKMRQQAFSSRNLGKGDLEKQAPPSRLSLQEYIAALKIQRMLRERRRRREEAEMQ